MVNTALFTAVICAVAPFVIPIGPIPLTLASLAVYIAAGTLGLRYGVISVMLYVALGAVGMPVFSNFEGGFYKIAGLTGGFIIGYILCAAAAGAIIDALGNSLLSYVLGMVAGTVLLYTCGVVWFMLQTGSPLAASLILCVVPFLPGDALKIVLACITAPKLREALSKLKAL